jgi:hypothetical protein
VLRISFEIASFRINGPLPEFLVVFRAVPETIFWNAAELFCHGRLNGLNVSIAIALNARFCCGNKKKSQGDIWRIWRMRKTVT